MKFLEGAMDASARKKSEGLKTQFGGPADLLSAENKASFDRILGDDRKQPSKPEGGGGGPVQHARGPLSQLPASQETAVWYVDHLPDSRTGTVP
jgi:hypothetical protein